MADKLKFLCVSSYFKGEAFLEACAEAGNEVYLITSSKLQNEAWPWHAITEVFYMEEDENRKWNQQHLVNAIAFQMREKFFDRFIALDDFDVEKVAALREQFRTPGMGDSTSRFFRDKLAMRVKAQGEGIPVPAFTPLFNDSHIKRFIDEVPGPWMIKPRSEASAVGIKKVADEATLWGVIEQLGDNRHRFVLERFSPGTVYHADALTFQGKVVFCRISRYLDTPFEVAHGGGIFRSQTLEKNDPANISLTALNERLLKGFGMQYSASHTEFIEDRETGEFLFLETSSRVGGAHLAEMVEAASGINLWAEWAKLETAIVRNTGYKVPKDSGKQAGIVVSLSRYEHPDDSQFTEPEIVWRMKKSWHIGLIVRAAKANKVLELLNSLTNRIHSDYHGSAPAPDRSP